MKLWLAYEIQNCSLTQEFRNEIGTVAATLPRRFFIEDEEARRLNTIHNDFSPAKRIGLSPHDFLERATAIAEVHEWIIEASRVAGMLRCQLADFIATVERFDPFDPLYWQRVYTLAGVEYSPPRNAPFGIGFPEE